MFERIRLAPDAEARFWAKVNRNAPNGCWEWTAAQDGHGYGQLQLRAVSKTPIKAYRLAYEMFVEIVPEGMTIDHLCRNTLCVNPEHMQAVTMRTNILRSDGVSARHARKTECINGHPFTPENTYCPPGRVHRMCRACIKARKQSPAYKAREAAAARARYRQSR